METDLEKLYQNYVAAWSTRDIEAVVSFFTDDCVYEDVALGVLNRGASEVRAFVQATLAAIPDFKIEPKSVFATVGRLGSEWIMSGTQTGDFPGLPATGKAFTVPVASIMEFHNGKIRRNTDYWNLASFLQQVGAMA
ncbi:MAG: ester cyclase [Verrucomicrobia subdivision 3 bacterium]|nr:ester cyclase [Limisphaerales bacterium]